jgi:hypothetical protein
VTDKLDHKRTLDAYHARSGEFRIVDVPPLQYLMIDGRGDPNTEPRFGQALEALYPVAYALKFASKQELGRDYTVMPLEGLWWADDHRSFTSSRDKALWRWTLLMMVPDWITPALFEAATAKVSAKPSPAALADVRLELLDEGRCVQTLHLGPFDDEAPTLAAMHDEFIPANGLRMRGRHHEIYFSDQRKVDPSKFRTILRQPVEPV